MEYDSTANINPLYEYKKTGFLTKLSTMFGKLDYNKMKANHHLKLSEVDFEYIPVPPEPLYDSSYRGDRFEYMTEEYSCKPDLEWLNSRGKEGWELTSVLTSGNIIWKRKINI